MKTAVLAILFVGALIPTLTYQPAIRLYADRDGAALTSYCGGTAVDTPHVADYPQPGESKAWATFAYNGLGVACLHLGNAVTCSGLDQPDPNPPHAQCPGGPCTIWGHVTPGNAIHVWLSVQGEPVCHGVLTASVWDAVLFVGP